MRKIRISKFPKGCKLRPTPAPPAPKPVRRDLVSIAKRDTDEILQMSGQDGWLVAEFRNDANDRLYRIEVGRDLLNWYLRERWWRKGVGRGGHRVTWYGEDRPGDDILAERIVSIAHRRASHGYCLLKDRGLN